VLPVRTPAPVAAAVAAMPASAEREDWAAKLHANLAQGASGTELLALLQALAADQPARAIELALGNARSDEERGAWVNALVGDWARREPQQTWDWLQANTDRLGSLANAAILAPVWTAMAARDPQLVVKNADEFLSEGRGSGGFAAQIVAQSAIQALLGREAADYACVIVEYWAHSPLADQVGAGTFTDVARSLATTSPDNALAWLKTIPPSADRNVALGEIAADAMSRDPTGTLSWASSLGPEEGRGTVMPRAFSEWVERDAAAAGQWLADRLAKSAPAPEDDAMIANIVNTSSLVQTNPTAALGWIAQMTDPTQRANAHEQVLLRWAASDFAAASAYVQQDPALDSAGRAAVYQKIQAQQAAPDRAGPWFAADSVAKPGG
jgi:hypothetical protein